ncbi:OLC1v1031838C1 [Oldenlandia corymbosa var. corymbosa]|uniref:OLC1v1031838C1 n=1 Tax=Oldenlandia corymbosa var. corymbosa TaxID=529605 RepID=A0AAV1CJH0_OLDCO|nr:OLC1v1031838C1 [Oldenlandia corymbosa var. corymbosa]
MDNTLIPWYLQMDDTFLFQDTTFPTIPHLDHTLFPDLQNPTIPPSNSALVFNSMQHQEKRDQAVATATTKAPVATTSSTPTAVAKEKRKRVSKSSKIQQDGDDNEKPADDHQKRVFRRDTERQRRQEMANLYASLRKFLPLEYLKGQRSTVDQLHQAENYIKHKKEEIRELELKRDKLRNLFGKSADNIKNNAKKLRSFSSNVEFKIRPCSTSGIEVLISCNLSDDDDWFPLSRVLSVLRNEGLTVVSCMKTKVNRNLHCVIQTEVGEGACKMNDREQLSSLEKKLDEEVIAWKSLGPCLRPEWNS